MVSYLWELGRRNVLKVAAAYAIVRWTILGRPLRSGLRMIV